MRLYIIGNGFDLNHGLPTSYWNYRDYLLQANPALVGDYEFGEYFRAIEGSPNTRWNDLETGLELLYDNAFEDVVSTYYPDMNSERTPGWDDINVEIENRFSFLRSFTGEYFYQWISSIENYFPNVAPKYVLNKEDAYVTFNYTRTLEMVYGIPNERILHLHGLAEKAGSIQFGNPSNVPENIQGELERTYSNDGFYNVVLEPAISSMARFADSAYKNILSNVTELTLFLQELQKVDEIVIMGHTMSGVDYPYYRDVFVPNYRNALWTIYVFNEVAAEEATRFASSSQLANCRFMSWM